MKCSGYMPVPDNNYKISRYLKKKHLLMKNDFRQYRTELAVQIRSQIFRQIV